MNESYGVDVLKDSFEYSIRPIKYTTIFYTPLSIFVSYIYFILQSILHVQYLSKLVFVIA